MKRLITLLLIIISIPLSAKENWILSTSFESSYFDKVFAPGFTIKADVLLFDWNLDSDPQPDGYGLSIESGILFPVRKIHSGVSPFFKLGVLGRKDFTDYISMDFRFHVLYTLTGRNMPGNGIGPRKIRYFQNTGMDIEGNFIYKLPYSLEFQTGITLGMLFPLESRKGKGERPEFMASYSISLAYNFH